MKSTRIIIMAVAALVAAGAAWWLSLSDSKKRFYKHLGKQVPFMPFRYFA